ncbi:aldo/keto reductase [Paramicrobacterium fandaimingii]|uniref:aldo/keto reductase n=1 Tax=Paramicrobacterium fandaimingii TaxID=2708079 RepID=UPI00141F036C|nr:aldo/keto reductase [Microbacterium fandaimingii]
MTDITARRRVGATGLTSGPVVFGTSGIGQGGDTQKALSALRAAAEAGLRDWDTSNGYGRAEEYVGRVLVELPSGSIQVFTKADPRNGSTDFSGARVRESVRESRERLGLDTLPVVHLHDPERITFDEAMADDGPVRALVALRDEGVVGHIGVAGGPAGLLERFVETGEFELLVTHNRYTLLDRSADRLLDACAERGMGVFNAAPFGGGALTTDEGPIGTYHYRPVSEVQKEAVLRIREIASARSIPVGALALGLSLRDPRITGTIVGSSSRANIERVIRWASQSVPHDVWPELDDALPDPAHQLGPDGR